jgi:hypothetical protein
MARFHARLEQVRRNTNMALRLTVQYRWKFVANRYQVRVFAGWPGKIEKVGELNIPADIWFPFRTTLQSSQCCADIEIVEDT